MLGRCAELVGPEAGKVAGGTFHSVANALLRLEHDAAGIQAGFGILAADDAESIVARVRETVPEAKSSRSFPKKGKIYQVISRAANMEKSVRETINAYFPSFWHFARPIEAIAEGYAEIKRRESLLDFDDLLAALARLMTHDEGARLRLASRYTHVLVDEYQDTNAIQARIVWQLGRDHRNVTAVGDDAQSIYGFRGADFNNIMEFPYIFAPARVIKLEANYRSLGPILTVANGILKGASRKYDKTLLSVRGEGPRPLLALVSDVRDEAEWVASRIAELARTGTDLSEIAVLFRASSHSFELEVRLTRLNLPYTKYGGRRFLEGAHVKDYLAFFRAAHNPADETSIARIASMLPGVGAKGSASAAAWVGGRRSRLLGFSKSPLKPKAKEEAADLYALLSDIGDDDDAMGNRPSLIMDYLVPLLEKRYPDDHVDRAMDIVELKNMAQNSGSLSAFLADVTLDPPNSSPGKTAKAKPGRDVSLSTIHSAKGLEWGHVFVLSATEGRIPSSYSFEDDREMEEERRLFYVAVTRAKDELCMMSPTEISGMYGAYEVKPTRFLSGLGKGELDVIKGGRGVDYRLIYPDDDGDSGFSEDGEYTRVDPLPVIRGFKGVDEGGGFTGPALPPVRRAAWVPPRDSDQIIEPSKGDRVGHRAFGAGTVLSYSAGKAVIEFDTCGRKTIVCKHAKLFRPQE
jgi:DNA helicase-2/ATP-dependent DNA helicase PcrA